MVHREIHKHLSMGVIRLDQRNYVLGSFSWHSLASVEYPIFHLYRLGIGSLENFFCKGTTNLSEAWLKLEVLNKELITLYLEVESPVGLSIISISFFTCNEVPFTAISGLPI